MLKKYINSPEEKILLLEELHQLEAKPVNGWDSLYPHLFNKLDQIITDLATHMDTQKPYLIVEFRKPHIWQAHVIKLNNGNSLIHIGSEFIKNTLLASDNDQEPMFIWAIAHELGHLKDPLFGAYAQLFFLRKVWNNTLVLLFYAGILSTFWQRFQNFIAINPYLLCGISVGLMGLSLFMKIALHRSFEYNADKFANEYFFKNDLTSMKHALLLMNTPINAYFDQDTPEQPRTILEQWVPTLGSWRLYKYLLKLKISIFHPSPQSRLNRLKKSTSV